LSRIACRTWGGKSAGRRGPKGGCYQRSRGDKRGEGRFTDLGRLSVLEHPMRDVVQRRILDRAPGRSERRTTKFNGCEMVRKARRVGEGAPMRSKTKKN